MIPVGDYPNPPRAQWVTRVLIGLNIAIYLFISVPLSEQRYSQAEQADPETAAVLAEMWEWQRPHLAPQGITPQQFASSIDKYSVFTFKYGYRPASPSLLALLFCMFLHGSFGHLFGNMLFLWIYGDNVEYRLGPVAYLLWYLGTGVVATLTFAFLDSASLAPLVGASGAISGILGFYLIWFPHNYVKVFFLFPFFGIIPIRAYWILGIYLVLENIMPALGGSGSNVAYGAHIGGFIAGMLVAVAYNQIKGALPAPKPERLASYRPGQGGPVDKAWSQSAPAPVSRSDDTTSEFEKEIRAGQMESAAHAFALLNREGGSPPSPDSVFRLAQWLYAESFVDDAASVFRYYLKRFPRGDDLDRVHLGLGVLLARRLGNPRAAREHLHQAAELTDSAQIAATAREELERLT